MSMTLLPGLRFALSRVSIRAHGCQCADLNGRVVELKPSASRIIYNKSLARGSQVFGEFGGFGSGDPRGVNDAVRRHGRTGMGGHAAAPRIATVPGIRGRGNQVVYVTHKERFARYFGWREAAEPGRGASRRTRWRNAASLPGVSSLRLAGQCARRRR